MNMPISRQTLGDLACHVVTPAGDPQSIDGVVILCHGFGAPGDDLVPLAAEIVRRDPPLGERLMFVFPVAPLTLAELAGGRAWWPIDMTELQAAQERGIFRDRRLEMPEQLPAARGLLQGMISAVLTQTGLPLSRLVLGGFSQGSMLATDVTLRLDAAPAGLIIFSGTLLCEAEWRKLAPGRKGLPVLQCHGTSDPLLPFQTAEWLRDLLTESGMQVEFHSFAGMHTIDREGLQSAVRLIDRVLPPLDNSRA